MILILDFHLLFGDIVAKLRFFFDIRAHSIVYDARVIRRLF